MYSLVGQRLAGHLLSTIKIRDRKLLGKYLVSLEAGLLLDTEWMVVRHGALFDFDHLWILIYDFLRSVMLPQFFLMFIIISSNPMILSFIS